jgi:hypothetical protein
MPPSPCMCIRPAVTFKAGALVRVPPNEGALKPLTPSMVSSLAVRTPAGALAALSTLLAVTCGAEGMWLVPGIELPGEKSAEGACFAAA